MPNDSRDLRQELIADLEEVEDAVWRYNAGRFAAYQTVAIQLRNLLLGGRRGLLLRVIPDAMLHPLPGSGPNDRELEPGESELVRVELFGHGSLRLPAEGRVGGLDLVLDRSQDAMTVETWLGQWIVSPGISIRALIEHTADEEVAHTQDERGKLLSRLHETGFKSIAEEDLLTGNLDNAVLTQPMHHMAIIALGEAVASRVRELLAET